MVCGRKIGLTGIAWTPTTTSDVTCPLHTSTAPAGDDTRQCASASPSMAIISCCFIFPLRPAVPVSAILQSLSPRTGRISKLWHPAQRKKSKTDTVCPIRTQAQQVINTQKLFHVLGQLWLYSVSCNTFQGTSHSWLLHWCYPSSSPCTFVFIICALSCCFFWQGSEGCFPRPLGKTASSAVLCMEGCSLNLFSQKAHHKTCLISIYLVCSHQTESIYRPRLLLTLLSALDYSSLPPLSEIKC